MIASKRTSSRLNKEDPNRKENPEEEDAGQAVSEQDAADDEDDQGDGTRPIKKRKVPEGATATGSDPSLAAADDTANENAIEINVISENINESAIVPTNMISLQMSNLSSHLMRSNHMLETEEEKAMKAKALMNAMKPKLRDPKGGMQKVYRKDKKKKIESDGEHWGLMFDALKLYGDIHGNCNVPFFFETVLTNGQTAHLGFWLGTQRKYKKRGKLRPEHDAMLQELVDQGKLKWQFRTNPLVQNPVTDAMGDAERWELMYSALVRYGEENGHCNVPHHIGFTLDGQNDNVPQSLVRLGFWLGTQRKYKKAGKMKPEQEARLQVLVDAGKLKWCMRIKGSRKPKPYMLGGMPPVSTPVTWISPEGVSNASSGAPYATISGSSQSGTESSSSNAVQSGANNSVPQQQQPQHHLLQHPTSGQQAIAHTAPVYIMQQQQSGIQIPYHQSMQAQQQGMGYQHAGTGNQQLTTQQLLHQQQILYQQQLAYNSQQHHLQQYQHHQQQMQQQQQQQQQHHMQHSMQGMNAQAIHHAHALAMSQQNMQQMQLAPIYQQAAANSSMLSSIYQQNSQQQQQLQTPFGYAIPLGAQQQLHLQQQQQLLLQQQQKREEAISGGSTTTADKESEGDLAQEEHQRLEQEPQAESSSSAEVESGYIAEGDQGQYSHLTMTTEEVERVAIAVENAHPM